MKRVYVESAWKFHSLLRGLIDYPPVGYEFFTTAPLEERLFDRASRLNLAYWLQHAIGKVVPLTLARAQWGRFRRPPDGTDLTWAHGHLVLRQEPWVVDVEYVSLLIGFTVEQFRRYRRLVERAFRSEYCRKIFCQTEASRRTVRLNLDCSGFEEKLTILPHAVAAKKFTKPVLSAVEGTPNQGREKLLFVGSANILGEFYVKGGLEALETFVLLKQKYDNIELVVRSDIPPEIKRRYSSVAGLRIMEGRLPEAEMEHEFQTADISILPAHNTPFSGFLDAMSYELPVVTIDAWANSELVEDGKTGFVVKSSEKVPYYVEKFMPNFGAAEFERAIRTPDPVVVKALADKVSRLIDQPELGMRLGKAGRYEVEQGRFSIENRKRQLQHILDEATGERRA